LTQWVRYYPQACEYATTRSWRISRRQRDGIWLSLVADGRRRSTQPFANGVCRGEVEGRFSLPVSRGCIGAFQQEQTHDCVIPRRRGGMERRSSVFRGSIDIGAEPHEEVHFVVAPFRGSEVQRRQPVTITEIEVGGRPLLYPSPSSIPCPLAVLRKVCGRRGGMPPPAAEIHQRARESSHPEDKPDTAFWPRELSKGDTVPQRCSLAPLHNLESTSGQNGKKSQRTSLSFLIVRLCPGSKF